MRNKTNKLKILGVSAMAVLLGGGVFVGGNSIQNNTNADSTGFTGITVANNHWWNKSNAKSFGEGWSEQVNQMQSQLKTWNAEKNHWVSEKEKAERDLKEYQDHHLIDKVKIDAKNKITKSQRLSLAKWEYGNFVVDNENKIDGAKAQIDKIMPNITKEQSFLDKFLHANVKVYVNGHKLVDDKFGKNAYSLNTQQAHKNNIYGGSVKIMKTNSGMKLVGPYAMNGYRIDKVSFWAASKRSDNADFGFSIKVSKLQTLTIKAHYGKASKNIGKGFYKYNDKISLNTRGYHFHGKAILATHKVHGKNITYIKGLHADPHYKITSIKLVNSHKNTTAHVYVKKS